MPGYTFPSEAKDLEAVIPDTICGAKVQKLSLKGKDVFNPNNEGAAEIEAVLNSIGKTTDDVTAAAGFGLAADSGCSVTIIRITGANEGQLRDVLRAEAVKEKQTFTETTVGGKTVYQGDTGKFDYTYIKGDGVIILTAGTQKGSRGPHRAAAIGRRRSPTAAGPGPAAGIRSSGDTRPEPTPSRGLDRRGGPDPDRPLRRRAGQRPAGRPGRGGPARLVDRAGIDPALVEDVILGCANQAGEDNRDVARMALLLADFPVEVGGLTVNRLCGSGLQAINSAAHAIAVGDGDVFIGGGVESMTRAPYVQLKAESAYDRGNREMADTTLGWRFVNPRLAERHYPYSMGETAENVAERWGVSRERQDAFALESQQRAVAAIEAGRFADQIVPISVPQRKGEPLVVDRDEHPRADTTLEALARLQPGLQARGRHGHGRQQLRDQRRRVGGPAGRGGPCPRARPAPDGARRRHGRRRRRPGDHGRRPRAGHAQGARARRDRRRGPRPRSSSTRRSRRSRSSASTSSASIRPRSTSTAARSRSAIRSG